MTTSGPPKCSAWIHRAIATIQSKMGNKFFLQLLGLIYGISAVVMPEATRLRGQGEENALERVLVVPGEGPIEAEELGFLAESTGGRSHEIAREALAAGVSLEALERALLEAALAQTRGNASAAARVLGLSRRAFDYRRKKLSE